MKRSKICYIACLILSGLVVPLLLISSDVNALKHTYTGLFYKSQEVPYPIQRNNENYLDFNSTNFTDTTIVGGGFQIKFEGDSYDDYVKNYKLTHKVSNFLTSYNYSDNYCQDANTNISPMFQWVTDDSTYRNFVNSSYNHPQVSEKWTSVLSNNTNLRCRRPHAFGSNNVPVFNSDNLHNVPMSCDFNLYGCVGVSNSFTLYRQDYYNDYINPYWTSSNGFWLMSKAVDTQSGIHYSHTWSFRDMFSIPVKKFSYLSLPFNTTNDYFYDSDNLYKGRHFDFNMVMEFDGDFNWHENIETNGSSIKIMGQFLPLTPAGNVNWHDFNRNCTANLRDVPAIDVKQLEISCPVDLPDDMILLNLQLVIDGNGNYVFETNDDWRIGQMYIVTDYDDTKGEDFNDDLIGNDIMGDAEDDISSSEDNADWFDSLLHLFSFGLINPFAPLFEMFSDNSTCVNVPTLAGMIHLENDEVCPWFSSSTRAITTPVLSISAMMLLFGFVVRWLGSSSGNFMEDGRHEEVTNKWSGGWGHWKK